MTWSSSASAATKSTGALSGAGGSVALRCAPGFITGGRGPLRFAGALRASLEGCEAERRRRGELQLRSGTAADSDRAGDECCATSGAGEGVRGGVSILRGETEEGLCGALLIDVEEVDAESFVAEGLRPTRRRLMELRTASGTRLPSYSEGDTGHILRTAKGHIADGLVHLQGLQELSGAHLGDFVI